MTTPRLLCFYCKHYLGSYQCAAFPDGIPKEILSGDHSHVDPFKGDQGIRYEMSDEEKKRQEEIERERQQDQEGNE